MHVLLKSFTDFVNPNMFFSCAVLITGTIKLPFAKAVAMPKWIFLCFIIFSPFTDMLIKGKSIIDLMIDSNIIGVYVIFHFLWLKIYF